MRRGVSILCAAGAALACLASWRPGGSGDAPAVTGWCGGGGIAGPGRTGWVLGGVRSVAAAHSGPVLPPFDPASVAGLTLWVDASDASTLEVAGGRLVGWGNKAQGGNPLLTAALDQGDFGWTVPPGAMPPYFDALTHPLGTVTFASEGDYMYTASGVTAKTLFFVIRTSSSIGFLSSPLDTLSRDFGLRALPPSGGSAVSWQPENASDFCYDGSMWIDGALTDQCCADGFVVMSACSASGYDGERLLVSNVRYLAYGREWVGSISEFLCYDSVLSPTAMALVEGYLGAKWGVSVSSHEGVPPPPPACVFFTAGQELYGYEVSLNYGDVLAAYDGGEVSCTGPGDVYELQVSGCVGGTLDVTLFPNLRQVFISYTDFSSDDIDAILIGLDTGWLYYGYVDITGTPGYSPAAASAVDDLVNNKGWSLCGP